MMFIVSFIKNIFFIIIFFGIFYAVGEGAFFERSVIILIYVVYISRVQTRQIEMLNYASILMLGYFKKLDDGKDAVLTQATGSLFNSLDGQANMDFINEASPTEVKSQDMGFTIAEMLEVPFLIIMLIWLVIPLI